MICVQVYFITKCSGFAAPTNKNPCALAHGQFQISPQKTPWSVLRTATKNAALAGDTILEKSVLEPSSGLEPETSSLPWMRSTS